MFPATTSCDGNYLNIFTIQIYRDSIERSRKTSQGFAPREAMVHYWQISSILSAKMLHML